MKTSDTWATKYRPKTLADIHGQEGAVAQIKGFLKSGKIPSTIMINGPTGTGKTTLARIIAAEINEFKGDPNKNPLLSDYNIGDQRGIDSIRDIAKTVNFLPQGGKFRVILLDEVHALTTQAAAAILKPLEEPPEHIVWILCTDQPEKVLGSIKGRNAPIKLGLLSEGALLKMLKGVYKKEKLRFGGKYKIILKKVAAMAGGQPRISLQLLQAVNNVLIGSDGEIEIKKALNLAMEQVDVFQTDKVALKCLVSLYAGKADKAIAALGDTKEHGGIINIMLELNKYMVEIVSGGQVSYRSGNRMALQDYLKEKQITPSIGSVMKIHNVIVDAKFKAGSYLVPEYHLLASGFSTLVKKEAA